MEHDKRKIAKPKFRIEDITEAPDPMNKWLTLPSLIRRAYADYYSSNDPETRNTAKQFLQREGGYFR